MWAGGPVRVPVLHPSDFFAVTIGLFVIVFMSFFITMALVWTKGHVIGLVVAAIALPILLLGLYLLAGRMVLRRIAIRNSEYVLTYRRLRVTTRVLGRRVVRAAWLKDLTEPRMELHADGVGTIVFPPGSMAVEIMSYRWMHFLGKRSITLHGIADAAGVRDKIVAMIPRW